MVSTTARNASLQDLAALLQQQHSAKVDIVAPAHKVRSEGGVLVVTGADAEITEDGVTQADGRYLPTKVFDEGVADKLGIPLAYLRRLREERTDLYDANVNGWLHGLDANDPDGRKFLLRCFRAEGDGLGVARAFLSDSYKVIDNFDVLTAALTGIRNAGIDVNIDRCDLTDRRMYVRIHAPAIEALAPTLLRGYRSPFTGATGDENPTVFAGFVVRNSETGGGAFTITPEITVRVCTNGMTITKDALRNVHLGSKMDEGVVRWSAETQQRNLALVTSQTKDAVQTFLDVDYVKAKIAEFEQVSSKPIADPAEDIKVIGKRLAFDEETTKGVLDFFIKGGQVTAGGVLQAVTAYAQTVEDADKAYEINDLGVRALEVAAAL